MKVRWLQPGEGIGAVRGDVVVCIPVYGGHDLFVKCVHSVLAHTSPSVRIMIFDDASPDERTSEFMHGFSEVADDRQLFYLRREFTIGFPANVNGAFAAAAPADVVVLNSDCLVAEGWLEGLHAAAYDSDRVATATALTNHGSIVSVPDLWRPQPAPEDPWDFKDAAAAVRRRSRRVRPRLPTAVGHCMYIRRTALELVGDFDVAFTPGYGEEVDLSQRCLLSGLCHVLADDVLVLHYGGGSFVLSDERQRIQEAHERIIGARYPYYHDGLRALSRTDGPLSQALNAARRALTGSAVTVDLRGSTDDELDEQDIVGWIRALAQNPGVRLAVLTGADSPPGLASMVGRVEGVAVLGEAEARAGAPADVVHRLGALSSVDELAGLRDFGERVILTQGDVCSYHNPAYYEHFRVWESRRALNRQIAELAEGVVFLSEHARADALAEGLLDPRRARTARLGLSDAPAEPPRPPRLLRDLGAETETILCLQPSLRSMNRLFALRLLEQLQQRHDWNGKLLLVGDDVDHGSSFRDERRLLSGRPRLAAATVVLPAVDPAERRWLLGRCRLVLQFTIGPSLDRTPFDAARQGVPSLWAPGTWLDEVIDEQDGTVIRWDAADGADRAFGLLRDPSVRERNLTATRAAASRLTWAASAEALLEAYDDICALPLTRGTASAPPDSRTHSRRAPGAPGPESFLTRTTLRLGRHAAQRARRRLELR